MVWFVGPILHNTGKNLSYKEIMIQFYESDLCLECFYEA